MDNEKYLYRVKVEGYTRTNEGIKVNMKRSMRNIFNNYRCVEKIWNDFISEIEQQLTNELNNMSDESIQRMIEERFVFEITLDESTGKFVTNYSLELDQDKLEQFSKVILDFLSNVETIALLIKERINRRESQQSEVK